MIRKLVLLATLCFITSVAYAQDVVCPEGYVCTQNENNSTVTSNTNSTAKVESPPPSAISPSINASNSDLCTVGVAGAVQTQILGISAGKTVRDMNCEKLKNAKTLYDMGMKVAAVSVMCQDRRVFDAMQMAGTPCPYNGKIGEEAYELWRNNPQDMPKKVTIDDEKQRTNDGLKQGLTIGGILAILAFAL